MAINFPSSPTVGQAHNVEPGKSFYYWDGVWVPAPIRTALPKNYLVNPSMQIGQQFGYTASTSIAYDAADQWFFTHASNATVSVGRVASATPLGSTDRVRSTVTVADTSIAAAEYWFMGQHMEGTRIADLRWGTANAKQVVLRFGWKGPAGTVGFFLRAGTAFDATYLGEFTITAGQANTDTYQTFVIPGPTFGTFPTDNTKALTFSINPMMGSQRNQGVLGWNVATHSSTPNTTNGLAVAGAVFELFDAYLYADPYKTGVAPPFELPNYAQELRRCQRYWTPIYASRGFTTAATLAARMSAQLPAPMRVAPTISILGIPKVFDGAAGVNMTSLTGNYSNAFVMEQDTTCSTGLTAGRPADQYWDADTNCLIASARM